jgi:outer membrane receptor protein involved in Fe transport
MMPNRIVLSLITTVLSCFAQTTSDLSGSVKDSTGAIVTQAEIELVNTETGAARTAQSSDSGAYAFALLPPGGYRVTVRKTGFRSVTQENLRLEVNQSARLDFMLQVGDVTESIQVTESAPLLDSNTSSLGQVIENKMIAELPLNGRNFVQLAILSPGVTGVGYGASGTIMSGGRPADLRPGSEIFSNGNREGSNNFMMDGVDNNVRQNFAITLRPSVEAVREFKIQTNLFAAEQGRNPGATINVVTKSGSNEWHGSAYEFLRNSSLDARNYYAPVGAAKPPFRQNQFGGSFGGRLIRNKAFFFANYEGYRRVLTQTSINTVPTPEMRVGNFSGVRDIFDPLTVRRQAGTSSGFVRDAFAGRMIPASRFDSVTRRLVQAYPLPDRAGLANNQITTPTDRQNWDQGDLRLDWNVSDRDMVYGRMSRQDTLTLKPSTFGPRNVPGMQIPVGLGNEDTFAGESLLVTWHNVLSWTHSFTPTLFMEAKMGFVRYDLNYSQDGASDGAQLGELLGVRGSNQGPRSDGIPIFSPAGFTGIGQTRSLPIVRVENTFHPSVNFTRIRDRHTFKWGLEARRRQMSEFQNNRGSGRFNFSRLYTNNPNSAGNTGDSLASFMLGAAAAIEQDFLLVFAGIRGTEYGAYFQDDWRVNDRLTLNLGLRYEYDTRFSEVANRWTNFDVATGKLLIAGFNSDRDVGVLRDANNFAPRFGFAYRGTQTTVVRGGIGVFYNTQGHGGNALRRQRQLPFGPINVVDINQFSPDVRLVQDGFPAIPNLDPRVVSERPEGSFLTMPANFKSGYTIQYNLQVQKEQPGWNVVYKLGYVGNLSRQLYNAYNFNQTAPGPGTPLSRRPLRDIAPAVINVDYAATDGIANYHGLQASAEKRFSSSLGFLVGYTWSHSIDNVGNDFGGAANGPLPQDIRYRGAAERGTSGHDIQHRLISSLNYALPIGKGRGLDLGSGWANKAFGDWQANFIFTSQTGLPFTPTLAAPVSNAGASRPDRLLDGNLSDRDPARWFDTSFNRSGAAWGLPAQFTFGNSARNVLRGPGRVNADISLFKRFAITEKMNLQFRGEMFNIFNTPQFGLPNASIGNPNAGIITDLTGTMRQIQFALRLAF